MAGERRNTTARRAGGASRNAYVDGSAVRRYRDSSYYYSAQAPARKRQPEPAPRRTRSRKELSESAKRNRERATGIGPGYVLFLVAISAAILFFCIHYLQLQTEITQRMKVVASLESELTTLKEDNDAYYAQVTSNLNLSEIKKIAIGKLGMRYPKDEQIHTYETEGRCYVRQYQDVPGA